MKSGLVEIVVSVALFYAIIEIMLKIDKIQLKTTYGEFLIILTLILLMISYAGVQASNGISDLYILYNEWKESRA